MGCEYCKVPDRCEGYHRTGRPCSAPIDAPLSAREGRKCNCGGDVEGHCIDDVYDDWRYYCVTGCGKTWVEEGGDA